MRILVLSVFVCIFLIFGCTDSKRISSLEVQLHEAKEKVNYLSGRMRYTRESVSNIYSYMDDLDLEISSLKSEIDEFEHEYWQSSIANIESAAADVELAFDDVQYEVEDLEYALE